MPRSPLRNGLLKNRGWLLVAVALLAAWLWWQQSPVQQGSTQAPPTIPAPRDTSRTQQPDAGTFPRPQRDTSPDTSSGGATLPKEAFDTLRLIQNDGPFPHRQDGTTFQNRERLLPRQDRGWYREYTVRTPGERTRGARRIVTGGKPPSEYFYTSDHYRSFQRFDPQTGRLQGDRLQ